MSDQRSYIEKRYGRDVANRFSRIFRAVLCICLVLLGMAYFAGLLYLSIDVQPRAMLVPGLIGGGVVALGLAMVWRMRKSDLAYYQVADMTSPTGSE